MTTHQIEQQTLTRDDPRVCTYVRACVRRPRPHIQKAILIFRSHLTHIKDGLVTVVL